MAMYPKSLGDKVTITDYNTVNCYNCVTKTNEEVILEETMSVTQLQYCVNVNDIPHDYLVVDAFTDSTGYNNTVCTCLTTSTYCCAGLAGYYENASTTSTPLCIYGCRYYCCQDTPGDGHWCGMCCGDYWAYSDMRMVKSCSNTEYQCLCSIAPFLCFDTSFEALCLKIYFIHNAHYDYPGAARSCFKTCVGTDCYSWCVNCASGDILCLSCLVWCNVGMCNWDFYVNGACVCQVNCNGCFPAIASYLEATTDGSNCIPGGQYLRSCLCVEPSGFYRCGKISTVPVTWASPVKSIYYTDNVNLNVCNWCYTCCLCCTAYCCTGCPTLCSTALVYYPMDETSGTTVCDCKGYKNGTLSNATNNQTGILGKAILFHGPNNQVTTSAMCTPAGNLSMFAWICPTWNTCCAPASCYGPIWERGASPYNAFRLSSPAGANQPNCLAMGFTPWTECSGTISYLLTCNYCNQWVHVGAVVNFTTCKFRLYINGVCVKENTDCTAAGTRCFKYIARYNTTASNCFNGKIDEVGIWTCALTATEVAMLYNSGAGCAYPFCACIAWCCCYTACCCGTCNVNAAPRYLNVIDSTTGCCIACNIPSQCNYLMCCCVCCHSYEIMQCGGTGAGRISCIKDYAIVVGV